ncbi:MAG: DUF2142 domain-containing protein [Sphingobium sp.]
MRDERRTMAAGARADMNVTAPWSGVERRLLAAVAAATLFFVCITPPFQAPDENQHYLRALWLAQGHVIAQKQGESVGAVLPRSATALIAQDFPVDVAPVIRLFDHDQIAQANLADAGRGGVAFAEFPNVASYAPTLYLPDALGLWVGEATGLSRLSAFYLARVCNALIGLGLLMGALCLLPFGRHAMLAVAMLPTFAYQTGSLSPDAVINGLGFLGLAIALRISFMGGEPMRTAGLFATAPLLALAKGVYLPLMAAGLRWPTGRSDRRPWLILAAMAAGAAVFLLWMRYSGGTQVLYYVMSRKTGEHLLTAPLADQLVIVVRDPAAFVHILATSIAERMPTYIVQIVGRFGWNAIMLPLLAYPLAGLMLMAGVLSGSGVRASVGQRLWWMAVALGVALLIEIAMYLTATPLGADYVQGTQGRYFLPVLPLALLALAPDRGWRAAPMVVAGSALLLLSVAMASAFDAFWVHGFVTDDGMPPLTDTGRALFLPSPRW